MRILSRIFKLILFVVIAIALSQEIYINEAIITGAFYYFTIQSNLLVAFCLLLFIFMPHNNRRQCLIRGVSLLAITITGLVYNFVLYNIFFDWGTVGYTFSRTVLHVCAPVGFILDWLLFDKHGMMKHKDILTWLLYPAIYCSSSLYANFRHGFSIYFFLNNANGYATIIKWVGILFVLLLIISCLYVRLDKSLVRKEKIIV